MSGTYSIRVGDRGRLVLPVELRAHQGWEQGTELVLLETESGVVLVSQEQAKTLVRRQLEGGSLVASLVEGRRRAARDEDVA